MLTYDNIIRSGKVPTLFLVWMSRFQAGLDTLHPKKVNSKVADPEKIKHIEKKLVLFHLQKPLSCYHQPQFVGTCRTNDQI